MRLARRGFLGSLGALLIPAPPVILRPGVLMPVASPILDPFIVLDLEGIGPDGYRWQRRERIARPDPSGLTQLLFPYGAFPSGFITKADWVATLPEWRGAKMRNTALEGGMPIYTGLSIKHTFEWNTST